MLYSIDVETACDVPTCQDFGKSMCKNDHSLSPWHSRITVAAAVSEKTARVFRGKTMLADLRAHLERDLAYTVCGQNFKFDWLMLARHGFEIPLDKWTADSQLAAYVLTEKIPDGWLAAYEGMRAQQTGKHRPGSKHGLKTLAPYFLDVPPFWEAQDHDDDDYVTKDALYSLKLVNVLEAKLHERGEFDFYKNKQLAWTKMLLRAEWRGIEIDMKALAKKEADLTIRSHELKHRLDKQWSGAHACYRTLLEGEVEDKYEGMKRNKLWEQRRATALSRLPNGVDYDSPAQMSWLLRDHLGYDISSLDGSQSTGAEVLERLASEGKDDVATYLEWRKTNKILTAFLPSYKELAVKEGDIYVIHPVYNPDSTRTGRTSSQRPNMQQVPPQLKGLFKAREGYKIIGYDAASIEAKLIALYSEDPTLYALMRDGISLHDHNTKVYFGLDCTYREVKELHADKRSAAKNVGFALFYNAGANRIRIAFAQKGYQLTMDQCRQLHKRFKEGYKTALAYSHGIVEYMEQGNVLSNLLGRPLHIEDPQDAYMKAFNRLIQSSASDLNLEGAHAAEQAMNESGIVAYPSLFVHDFAGFEVRDADVEKGNEILTKNLVNFDLQTKHGRIKLEVEGGVNQRWTK